jgi:Domain of unknown function (DUF4114)
MTIVNQWMALVVLLSLPLLATSARAACTFGASSEPTLQGVFDSMLGPEAPSATVDCVEPSADAVWRSDPEATATIIIELAGFAPNNVFGIYDPSNPTRQVTLFGGAAGAGSSVSLAFVAGDASGFDVQVGGVALGQFASSDFGFFLRTPQHATFFSQASLNGDGADHLYVYQGNAQLFIGGPLAGVDFATSMYLLAFEDLRVPGGDSDYQDFVAAINFMTPIPLPAGVLLLGSALALFASMRRGNKAPS